MTKPTPRNKKRKGRNRIVRARRRRRAKHELARRWEKSDGRALAVAKAIAEDLS